MPDPGVCLSSWLAIGRGIGVLPTVTALACTVIAALPAPRLAGALLAAPRAAAVVSAGMRPVTPMAWTGARPTVGNAI